MSTLHILALSGSLRRGSYNTALLRAAAELAPQGVAVEVRRLGDIPLYDEDVRTHQGFPPPVAALREAVAAADALLFATPEYNYSFSGVIKNAVDWLSRPPDPPLVGKPAAVLSTSPGITGGVRAQWALKPILASLGAQVLFRPEFALGDARRRFDEAGRLVDEEARARLAQLLESLVALARGG